MRVLLLDLALSDGDGLDLIQSLKSRPSARDLPIIVISARAEAGRQSAGAGALNVVDWMEKPVDIGRLRRAVTAALARTAPTRRPTILHVDDDHDILRVTAAALGACGEVVSVESLAAAKTLWPPHAPDLVVLDLALGDGSGLELLGELNDATGAPIPVLIFSAHDTDQLVFRPNARRHDQVPHLPDRAGGDCQAPGRSRAAGSGRRKAGLMSALKILYVEDEPDPVSEVACLALQLDPDIRVSSAESGEAALTMVADGDFRPDVLLLDVMMPGMDGPGLLRVLRERAQTAATASCS